MSIASRSGDLDDPCALFLGVCMASKSGDFDDPVHQSQLHKKFTSIIRIRLFQGEGTKNRVVIGIFFSDGFKGVDLECFINNDVINS